MQPPDPTIDFTISTRKKERKRPNESLPVSESHGHTSRRSRTNEAWTWNRTWTWDGTWNRTWTWTWDGTWTRTWTEPHLLVRTTRSPEDQMLNSAC